MKCGSILKYLFVWKLKSSMLSLHLFLMCIIYVWWQLILQIIFKSEFLAFVLFCIKISKTSFLVISNFMSKRITEVIDYKRSNQSAWHGPLSIYKRKTLQKYHIKTETRRMIFKDFPDIADSCFIFFYCKLY